MRIIFHAWLELARVSNLPTVWTNVLAAWLLCGGAFADARLFWMGFGASLLYTAGMILNDAADAAFDREHRPERPIPSGRIALRTAWLAGLILLLCGGGMMAGRGGADVAVTVVLALTVLGYDLYHKPWAGSVLLMGGCRTLLYLAAASPLVEKSWAGPALLPGLALGAYIVGLSLIARGEARAAQAGGGAQASVWVPLLLLASPVLLALFRAGEMGKWMPGVVGVGLLVWIMCAVRQMRASPPQSIGPAVGKLLAGIAWVDAAAIAGAHPGVALAFVLAVPLLLLWQRRIAAT